ncbi:S1C family serine protease [Gemella sp. zg-1178]|uniref:S1C family serine protease n=1 Tax=Gemella sp. zg-1178 TaxID=2840372 RepID=UPI001C054CEB|nr:trypsin-like peptidase domain-containing protein [Gemella sp. zg-1178]MBU0278632.1 trypsin-like peptidase domain-containing protein [Gemella sp. zg-1178]
MNDNKNTENEELNNNSARPADNFEATNHSKANNKENFEATNHGKENNKGNFEATNHGKESNKGNFEAYSSKENIENNISKDSANNQANFNEAVKNKNNVNLKYALMFATVFALGGLSVFGVQGFMQGAKIVQISKVAPSAQEEASETTNINAVSKSKDAVVSVVSYASPKNLSGLSNIIGDKAKKGDLQAIANGSGVIYKKDGAYAYVVTNHHVINGAEKVDVVLSDGTSVGAEILGSDIWTDLTVLKISAENVKVIMAFSNSDEVAVGQTALAIGSPLGLSLSNSVTRGIVSSKERQIPIDINNDGSYDWYQTVIQTDAAINPGNSGGALINSSGELIGINELKISNVREGISAEGIGFVIPANEVKIIAEQLEKNGKVSRPALGVQLASLSTINKNLAEEKLNYDTSKKGVVIKSVEAGSAAEKSNLKDYDIITKINDTNIESIADLRKYLFEKTKIGETINITYYRQGKEYQTKLTLARLDQ